VHLLDKGERREDKRRGEERRGEGEGRGKNTEDVPP
jgi:hypothetical protein